MKLNVNQPCPCGSKIKYKKCCKIFHNGALPSTALLLMKSRYSAFVAQDYKYIIKTTHFENSDYSTDLEQWKTDILLFAQHSEFKKLDILEFIPGEEESYVTFKATILQDGNDISFIEKSKFLKQNNQWYYHSGEFLDE